MDNIDYKKLYQLQDEVLDTVFKTENEFYLTGGTCLHRFYKEKRYSDDLDFFTHDSTRFGFAIKNIKAALQDTFKLKSDVESKNFIRLKINSLLQVDFINDVSSRYKDVVVLKNGYIIDNIENLLSNKITAIMGRDNPKDIFDLYLIWKYYSFSWDKILKSSHDKVSFNHDDFILRLKTFPAPTLSNLKIIDTRFLENFKNDFNCLIEELISL